MPIPVRSFVRRAILIGIALLLATMSCGREITGPSGLRVMEGFTFLVDFAMAGLEEGDASALVPFTRVRVVLVTADGRTVIDRVVEFPASATEVPLSFTVPVSTSAPATGELMDLSLQYINATGDTVFRAGPVEVTVVPSGSGQQPPPPPVLEPVYVGEGSEAVTVVVTPERDTLLAGTPFAYTAVALDGQGQPVATAPIAWRSATPTVAAITSIGAGAGNTLAARGPALIIAQLLTGGADTVFLEVLPRAQLLQVASGNNQNGAFNAPLASPIVARVRASDGLPLAGVEVSFAVTAGGGALTQSTVVTDAEGLAATEWTLGDGLGEQTVTATAAGLTGSPLVFTAQAPSFEILHAYPIATDLTDAVGGVHGTLLGGAIVEGGMLSLNGSTSYAEFPAHLIPTSGSYSVSLFVRNRTVLSFWAEYISQGTLADAFFIGHDPNGAIRVSDHWLNTGFPTPPIDGLFHHFVVTVDAAANTSRLYVDGVLRATLPSAITTSPLGTGTRLGRQHSGNLEYLDGEIDEVRIWRGAIPEGLIAEVYGDGLSAIGRLVFQSVPTTVAAGATLPSVVVRVEDGLGRLRTEFTGDVTIALAANPGDALLSGTLTVSAVAGVATFADLSLDRVGTGYTLSAVAAGAAPATSTPFDVTSGAASYLEFVQQPVGAVAGAVLSPAVTVRAMDAGGNVAAAFTGAVTLAIGTNPSGGVLGGTATVNAVAGVATFADLTIDQPGAGYTLAASAVGLDGATSGAFTITSASLHNVWLNAAGGLWSSAANWSLGRVPDATDTVAITTAGTYTVTMDGPATVLALIVGGGTGTQTLSVNTRTLTVSEGLLIEATGAVTTGTGLITGTGVLTNSGTLSMTGGTVATSLTNEGLAVLQGAVVWSGSVFNAAGATIRVQGVNGTGAATTTFSNGGANAGTIELTTLSGTWNSTINVGTGTLVNLAAGTVVAAVGTGGSRFITAQLENQGTLTVLATTTIDRAGADHVNSGTITVSGASNLSVTQTGTTPSFTNEGAVLIGAGRTFTITGGAVDLTAGTIDGASGTFATSAVPSLALTTASVRSWLALAGTTITGTLTIPASDSLRLLGGSPTITLVNEGRLVLLSNVLLSGSLTTTTTSVIESRAQNGPGSATPTINFGFTNNGLIELRTIDAFYSHTLAVVGELVNAPTGVIRSVPGFGGKTLAAQLNNQGLVEVHEALTLSRPSAVHVNSGTIDLSLANFTITQTGTTPSFTNTGTILVPGGRQLTVSGGALSLTGGTLDGPSGTLATTGVTLDFDIASARTVFDLTTTTVPGTFVIPAGDSLRLRSGSPTMTLQVDGRLVLMNNVVLNGSLTTVSTSVIESRAQNGPGSATPTINYGFTNNGLVELRTLDAFYSHTLTVVGPLVNASGAAIRAVPGFGGKTLAAELDNQGLLDVDEALTLARPSAVHLNSGTIDLALANLTIAQAGTTPSFTNSGTILVPAGRQLTVTGGTLNLTGGTLDGPSGTLATTGVTLNFDIASARTVFDLTTTTVPGTFVIPANDSLRLRSGSPTMTLQVDGRLVLMNNVVLNGSLATISSSVIESRAQNGPGSATPTINYGFINNGLIELRTLDAFYSHTLTVTGPLVNTTGAIIRSVPGFGTKTLAAALDNQGLLDVQEALILNRESAAHVNSGTIDLALANLTVTQAGTTPSFTNTGTILVPAGRQLTVTGGTLNLTGGTLDGPSGTLATTGVTLNFDIASARTVFDLTTTTVPGTFVIPANDSLRLRSGSPTMTLQVDGRLVLMNNVVLNGSLATVSSSVIESRAQNGPGSATPTINYGFINNGLVELRTLDAFYSHTLTVAGPLVNATGGIIRSVPGFGTKTLAAALDNQGLLDVQEALILNRESAAHVNSGTIDLALANLTVTQAGTTPSFTNTGTILVPSGRQLTVTGGTLNLTGGTLDGPSGTLATTGVTLNFDIASARAVFDLTTTTVPGTFVIPANDSLRLRSGSPTMTLQADGHLVLLGNVVLNGSMTTSSTSTIESRAQNGPGSATPTINYGFINNGLVELRTLDAFYSHTLTVAGPLVNATSGVIRSVPGFGTKTLAAELDNQGTVQVDETMTIARAGADHRNGGTIAVALANLTFTQTGTTPSFTNLAGGNITLSAGRELTFTSGEVDLSAGSVLGGTGQVNSNNTTSLQLNPATFEPRLSLTGTATLPGTLTIAAGDSLRVDNGVFAPTALVVDGQLILEGTVTVTTALTVNSGAQVLVRSSNATTGAGVTITNGFTNNGTITLTAIDATRASTVFMGAAPFVNGATGLLEFLGGSGGGRIFTAGSVENLGTIAANFTGSINGPVAQRGVLTVASAQTLTLPNLLTLYANSTSTVLGTLNRTGGCVVDGTPVTFTGFTCP